MNAHLDSATADEQTPSAPSAMGAGADTTRDTAALVRGLLEVLEPEQLSAVKHTARVGRRALRPGTLVLFWALRVYVVVMLILVAHQTWIALHP